MPLPSSPFPRSAPALTTSFSLPSLSTFPPSPANPYALPKEYRGPFASLSRKGSRWNASDEQDANGQDDEEERLKVRPFFVVRLAFGRLLLDLLDNKQDAQRLTPHMCPLYNDGCTWVSEVKLRTVSAQVKTAGIPSALSQNPRSSSFSPPPPAPQPLKHVLRPACTYPDATFFLIV